MSTKTFYLLNAKATGANHMQLQIDGAAPATATTGTGWTVGLEAADQYALMEALVERAVTVFDSTVQPVGGPNNTLGDCWRSESALSGQFRAGSWLLFFPFIAVTGAGNQDGRLRIRIWKGANATGSDAVELTAATKVTSAVTNLNTTVPQTCSITWSAPAVVLNSEYLFFQMAWEITGASSVFNADVLFRVGSQAMITSTEFIAPGTWRDHPYHFKGHLYVHNPTVIFRAQVDVQTLTDGLVTGTSIYQYIYIKSITVGALADIKHGMTLWLGTSPGLPETTANKGRCRVRDVRNVGGINVIAVWVSPNVHDGELALATNLYVTVVDEYRPWMKPPYYPDDGLGRYDGDNSYGGTVYNQLPIANAGPAYAQIVDPDTELITVTFDGSASFAAARRAVLGQYSADKTAPGITCSASSTYLSDNPVNAFNNDTSVNDYWRATGATNEWIEVTLPVAAVIRKFDLTGQGTNAPKNFWLQAYIDSVWQTVSLYTNQTGWGSTETRSYYVDEYDGRSATRWRLWVYQNNGDARTAVNELALFAEDRVTTSPYTWDVGDGTITVGAATDEQITATFPVGFRYVELTVTDTNGYTGVTHVPVLAAQAGMAGLLDDFTIVNHQMQAAGQEFEFQVYGPMDIATYPDNALVLYWEDEVYHNTAGSLAAAGPSGRTHMKFAGWIFDEQRRVEIKDGAVHLGQSIRALDIGGWLQELPAFPLVLMRKTLATPAYIYECDGLCIDRYIYLIMRWMTNAAEIADFAWSGTLMKYPAEILNATGATAWDQADGLAAHVGYALTCNKHGQLEVRSDPLRQPAADRTSTVIEALVADDLLHIEYTHENFPRAHWVWASAVMQGTQDYDDATLGMDTFFSVGPGETPGQGRDSIELGEQLVVDQTELNERAGLLYALSNAAQSMFNIGLAHSGDTGIDPAKMEWITLFLESTSSPRGVGFDTIRLLPRRVIITYEPDKMSKTVTIDAQKETDGPSTIGYTP